MKAVKKQKTLATVSEWGKMKVGGGSVQKPPGGPRLEALAWMLGTVRGDGDKWANVRQESRPGCRGVKTEMSTRDSQPGFSRGLLAEVPLT